MSLFTVAAIVISLTALLSWVTERYSRLPHTIGVLLAALASSLVLIAFGAFGLGPERWADMLLAQVSFDVLLMKGMLSFLLFAGALHVNLGDLMQQKWSILLLATVGTVLSTFLVGSAFWWLLAALGWSIPYLYALIFGALISPTDPIAVLSVLKQIRIPKPMQALISGESLFNDGVGVVIFAVLLGLIDGGHEASAGGIAGLFLREAVGGVVVGLVVGLVAYEMLRRVDQYTVEVLITLAVVMGGYALAGGLHASGPLAVVVAGLLLGNHGRLLAMSERTRQQLDTFWEMMDEILNAVLFVLIGLEVLVLELSHDMVGLGLLAVPLVLAVRFLTVGATIGALRWGGVRLAPFTVRMLSWSGVRGGISIALALALPPSPARDLILVTTYVVVVFSIVVQGLSIRPLAQRAAEASGEG